MCGYVWWKTLLAWGLLYCGTCALKLFAWIIHVKQENVQHNASAYFPCVCILVCMCENEKESERIVVSCVCVHSLLQLPCISAWTCVLRPEQECTQIYRNMRRFLSIIVFLSSACMWVKRKGGTESVSSVYSSSGFLVYHGCKYRLLSKAVIQLIHHACLNTASLTFLIPCYPINWNWKSREES